MKKIKEEWRPAQYICKNGQVRTFENYQVSNLGNVLYRDKYGKWCDKKSTKQTYRDKTYLNFNLVKNGKEFGCKAHRLVMSTFAPELYFKGAVVDHIDADDTTNNCISNLRWFSLKDNAGTEHFREKQRIAQTNHPKKSYKVRVTFPDGHQEIFPSAKEVDRSLGLRLHATSSCINLCNGYYKKHNLYFEYVV